jgi:uracil-DNA glycosylase family 4
MANIDIAEKDVSLAVTSAMPVRSKVPGARCWECGLRDCEFVPTYVPSTLDKKEVVVFIGEAPGEVEVWKQRGFVGPSGRFLKQYYTKAGGNFEAAVRTNACLCRPPENRDPTTEELDACRPRLQREIDRIGQAAQMEGKTLAVVALGKKAEKSLAEATLPEKSRLVVSPHPAYAMRRAAGIEPLRQAMIRVAKGEDSIHDLVSTAPEVIILGDLASLRAALDSIADGSWVCFDLETNNVNWYHRMHTEEYSKKKKHSGIFHVQTNYADPVLCMAFTTGLGYGWIIPDYILYDCEEAKQILSDFFERMKTVAHNGKFDVLFLEGCGIKAHVDFDTIALHYALCETPGTHGLKELGTSIFGVHDYEQALVQQHLINRNDEYSKVPEEKLFVYAVWDVCLTLALAQKFRARARASISQGHPDSTGLSLYEAPFNKLYMPALHMLTDVERRGVRVDVTAMKVWRERMLEKADRISSSMQRYSGEDINLASPKQVAWLLFQKLGLPRPHKARGVKPGSTGKMALEQLRNPNTKKFIHPALDNLLEWRTCRKFVSTYIDGLLRNVDVDGRVHTNYMLYGTESGRLSSRNPPLQTIPRGSSFLGEVIKSFFIPDPGCIFVDCDYSQAELRVLAAITRDPFLLRVYLEDKSIHDEVLVSLYGPINTMSELVYKTRKIIIKAFVFGYFYGAGIDTLVAALGSRQLAEEFWSKFEATMPVAAEWRNTYPDLCRKVGFAESRTGRRRRVTDLTKGTELINFPSQSGASDCTTSAGIRLNREGRRLVLLVHDETVTECRRNEGERTRWAVEAAMKEEAEKLYPEVKWKAEADESDRWLEPPSDERIRQWLESALPGEDQEMDLEDVDAELEDAKGSSTVHRIPEGLTSDRVRAGQIVEPA